MIKTKPVFVSGIRATGRLHIGNYLGALKQFVEIQNSGKYRCYFFIADYHALTTEHEDLKNKILDVTASYLAAGLDQKKSIIFLQSDISEHTELAWILSTVASFGELGRMTQFKEKSEGQKDNINLGLFGYPVLMAADVLLYDATTVPVGDDQVQHMELARTLARKFNSKFGKVFTEPKAMLSSAARIMSLTDPEKKMSKSEPKGCLFLDDSPKEIKEKIAAAVTDSGSEITFDEDKKTAVSNLIRIYGLLAKKTFEEVTAEFRGKGYADFK